ncbi:hypothetical protein NDA11_005738 [Ustilago hordei]|uniref:Uncharacterized protein n=1 Tax=Ustilago hordei TaxID=120017 RepID=I2G3X2_USTHO|nr:uncharacterized protein UHO2_00976 [Ustilago hordei]KAJ1041184.1 hypothetical protein NDA10_001643 [Ustilago hordei]KAJ1583820.1 hypothetical protein NDA15_007118 [Ustilago hordei]KAJ1584723.1 hypothetical protein NDA11_005738 [Ustilago hordei]KAJ1591757.1 hypothetical protein NDA12_002722 [Ustilago hordei]KAJ1603455.1 hypothetical protein NDA14_006807 [Ustilago hordei]
MSTRLTATCIDTQHASGQNVVHFRQTPAVFLATTDFQATLGSPRTMQWQNQHSYEPFDRAKDLYAMSLTPPVRDKPSPRLSPPNGHTQVPYPPSACLLRPDWPLSWEWGMHKKN